MRVITHLGFGDSIREDPNDMVVVRLDEPFLGVQDQIFRKDEMFIFTDWALLRVLNISGGGLFSNLQFFPSQQTAQIALMSPSPPDETRFLIDLRSPDVQINQSLNSSEDYQEIHSWVDRWAPERGTLYEDGRQAIACFDEDAARLGGATGIQASLLIDLEKQRLLRFFIAVGPPQGTIYRWDRWNVQQALPAPA